jgi:hypothetical protein
MQYMVSIVCLQGTKATALSRKMSRRCSKSRRSQPSRSAQSVVAALRQRRRLSCTQQDTSSYKTRATEAWPAHGILKDLGDKLELLELASTRLHATALPEKGVHKGVRPSVNLTYMPIHTCQVHNYQVCPFISVSHANLGSSHSTMQ